MSINTKINFNSFVTSIVLIAMNKSKKDKKPASYHFKRMKQNAIYKKYLYDEPIKQSGL